MRDVTWVDLCTHIQRRGELRIAEVASRFTDVDAFTSLVASIGFKLRSKVRLVNTYSRQLKLKSLPPQDESNTHFTLFEFVKVSRKPKSEKEWEKLMARGSVLKPCEYKRR